MYQQEWRLVDDDKIVGLIDHFEAQGWIFRPILSDVFLLAHSSGPDLRCAGRWHWISLSLQSAAAPDDDCNCGSRSIRCCRGYVRNFVQQVLGQRKPRRTILAPAAVFVSLSATGRVRVLFGRAAISNVGRVILPASAGHWPRA